MSDNLDNAMRVMAEQSRQIERLRASRDDWMSACNRAQDHRDGANAQLTIFESENLQLRNEIERLRAALVAAMEIVQEERTRLALADSRAFRIVLKRIAELDAIIAQADAALGSEK